MPVTPSSGTPSRVIVSIQQKNTSNMKPISKLFWVCLVVNGLVSSASAQNGTVMPVTQEPAMINITDSFTYRTKDYPKLVNVHYPTAKDRLLTENVISRQQKCVNETLQQLHMDKPKLTIISIRKLNETYSQLEYTLQILPPQEGIIMVILNLNFEAGSIHNEYNVSFAEKDNIGSSTIEPSKTTKDNTRYSFTPTTAPKKSAKGTVPEAQKTPRRKVAPSTPTPGADNHAIRRTPTASMSSPIIAGTKETPRSSTPAPGANINATRRTPTALGTKEIPRSSTPAPGANINATRRTPTALAIVVMGIFSIIVRFVAIYLPILQKRRGIMTEMK